MDTDIAWEIDDDTEIINDSNEIIPEKFVKLSAKDLTYQDFFRYYMVQNIPCLIQDVVENWENGIIQLLVD